MRQGGFAFPTETGHFFVGKRHAILSAPVGIYANAMLCSDSQLLAVLSNQASVRSLCGRYHGGIGSAGR